MCAFLILAFAIGKVDFTTCSAGGNGWGNLDYRSGWCKVGNEVSAAQPVLENASPGRFHAYFQNVFGQFPRRHLLGDLLASFQYGSEHFYTIPK